MLEQKKQNFLRWRWEHRYCNTCSNFYRNVKVLLYTFLSLIFPLTVWRWSYNAINRMRHHLSGLSPNGQSQQSKEMATMFWDRYGVLLVQVYATKENNICNRLLRYSNETSTCNKELATLPSDPILSLTPQIWSNILDENKSIV